jgi:chaperonin GroES
MSKKVKEAVMEVTVETDDVKFKPNKMKLLVRPVKEEKKTKAGILLPGDKDGQHKTFQGKVICIGEGVTCKVGDRIFYGQYAGIPTPIEEGFFLTMDDKDWLGIIG